MVLIYDIETQTYGKVNANVDTLKVFGWLDTDSEKSGYILENNIKKIQDKLNEYKIVVGFNVLNYDNVILMREGINFDYKKVIDLWDVVDKRKTLMKLNLRSYSLSSLSEYFNLPVKKQKDFDYKILCKNFFTEDELNYIWNYLKTDLETTKGLWDYLCDYFSGFKNYLNVKYIDNYSFVSCSGGALAYKAICSQAGIQEEYNERTDNYQSYKGGYVSLPQKEFYEGDIYLFDFTSLYPHMFMQANLYSHSCSCCKQEEKWHGNEMFTDIKGYYCTKEMGKIESVIKKLFQERVLLKEKMRQYQKDSYQYKELDKQQTSIKIIMNTIYGISGSPIFKHVYNIDTASDCTYLGRTCRKFVEKKLEEAGYESVYGDTDSFFVLDPFKDKERLLKVKAEIVDDIKVKFPFPLASFDMELETKIKKIYFFKKDDGKFAKKFYVYLNEKNDLVVKGIPIVKSNCSLLSEKIFKERIVPFIKETGELRFEREVIRGWISEELARDVGVAGYLLRVNDFETYKEETQLQAQVAKLYGAGSHYVIPNYIYGAGLCLKYCTVEDFKAKGIHLSQIALDNVYSELEYFCNLPLVSRTVSRQEQVKIRKKLKRECMTQLSQWI